MASSKEQIMNQAKRDYLKKMTGGPTKQNAILMEVALKNEANGQAQPALLNTGLQRSDTKPSLPRAPKKSFGEVLEEYNTSLPGIGQVYTKSLPLSRRQEMAQGTQKFFEQAPVQAGFMQGVSLNNPVKSLERKLDVPIDTSQAEKNLLYQAGQIGGIAAQFAVPYAGATKGIGAAVTKLPAISRMGRLGQNIARSAATDLAIGLPLNTNIALNKEGLRGEEALKNIGINTAIDLITGGILEAVPLILKSGKKVASQADFNALPATEKAEVMTELERLAYESNVRKGKITPQNDTLYGNSFRPASGALPAPTEAAGSMATQTPEEAFAQWRKENFGGAFGKVSQQDMQALRELFIETTQPNYAAAKRQREVPFTITKNELPNSLQPKHSLPKEQPKAISEFPIKPVQPVKENLGPIAQPEPESVLSPNTALPKAVKQGEEVIGIERGNKGTIAKRNEDGSYFVLFENKQTGKEALIKMQRSEFEPIKQTIMDLKASQKMKFEPQTPAKSNKLDEGAKLEISEIAPTIKDISGRYGQVNDIWEVFEKGFGKNYNLIKEKILNPFARSKGDAARLEIDKATELKNKIVNELGIKKGSKQDKAIMWYGEKKRVSKTSIDPQTGMTVKVPSERPYTLMDLQEEFPQSWQKIVQADSFFRKNYDEFIDAINAKRAELYPNAEENLAKINERIQRVTAGEGRYSGLDSTQRLDLIKKLQLEQERYIAGKRIPKRNDYYRHYREMTEGFAALKNVFDSPAQIGSNLAGISQFTKPKSKWLSLAQRRTGNIFEESAIGGYLDYLPAASYAIHIDPHIAKFRELADVLDVATDKGKNANNLIRTIREYADHLAGKTNKWDRIFEDMPGGRKGMKVVNWINNRVKANVILGNASSALSQVANIPNGIAWIKDPDSLAKGMFETLKGINKETAIKQSNFITERYKGNILQSFDEKLIDQPKKLAEWILGNADAIGTRFIWNSAYQKALKNGAKDAIMEADDVTRMLVAGRGIGEVPLNQQRNLTKIVAPFTLEVQNAWKVQKKFIDKKDFGGLIGLYVLSYGFNKGMEAIKGNGVLFDPIQAIYDAVTEEDLSPIERGGRLAGEVISNIPYGSTLAQLYPEYGIQFAEGVETPTRKELFGRNDPTRFGSGLVSQQALTDPVFKLAPSWGGNQLKKTYDSLKSTQVIPNLNPFSGEFGQKQEISGAIKDDKLRFPIERIPSNMIKGALFGNYATDEGKQYIENEGRPFSEKQTETFKDLSNSKPAFDFISKNRALTTKGEILIALQNSNLEEAQKKELLTKFYGYKLSDTGEELKPQGITLEEYQQAQESQKGYSTSIGKALALNKAGYSKMIKAFEISDTSINIADALKRSNLEEAYTTSADKLKGVDGSEEKKAIIDKSNPGLTRQQLVLLYEAFDVSQGVGRYSRQFNDNYRDNPKLSEAQLAALRP
jgi:hypothetical protein